MVPILFLWNCFINKLPIIETVFGLDEKDLSPIRIFDFLLYKSSTGEEFKLIPKFLISVIFDQYKLYNKC